jgi:hypothetical protein
VNTGSFCDERCSYLVVHDDGSFDLKHIWLNIESEI